ncbi:MAG: riboflavin biosynthesis protein RibF [Devosia sp. 67-54]|uniref:bifunctional riboflavin kinase/FAD synthetase n=1 Tax=unclassified Devosia TaxID=196773 RepID=UPI00086E5B97|nr:MULTISPECIES: bifunctional riboflavin kinase/FAD synthetase [unclassified Devosia]MBN9305305.1 bifunctional riboflavin kinase/FAD synthetase [Devosia sp.]ODU55874.1 MAG: riboflavin biosynthesis protein RibF [Acetobacteraceae bacterium SCN 69-10]OJX18908.1 MAG: riboflavin biosynthesis protein RibF [Devosia sp. 67-54]
MTSFYRLDGLDNVPAALKGCMVAIGSFDGVHRGHQAVLERLKTQAKARNVPAVMLTFEPHPRDVFAPAPFMFRLSPPDIKARLCAALGLDGIVLMPFSRDLSMVEAEDFVARFLVRALRVSGVVVGADFHFGHNRRGTPDFLRAAGAIHGFSVDILDLLPEGEEAVSSSRIRKALTEGEVAEANGLLGYHWFFGGEVVKGDQRGRLLGFPTANIATASSFALAQGVYAVRARLGERLLDGVASFGKPMFNNELPPFETFLFDFDADIYGRHLEIALISHIRGQEVYKGLDELIAAIARDSRKAREALGQCGPLGALDKALGFFA